MRCPRCKRRIPNNSKFCPYDGNKISNPLPILFGLIVGMCLFLLFIGYRIGKSVTDNYPIPTSTQTKIGPMYTNPQKKTIDQTEELVTEVMITVTEKPQIEKNPECSWEDNILGFWIDTSNHPYNFLLFYENGGVYAGEVLISTDLIDYRALDSGLYKCLRGSILQTNLDGTIYTKRIRFSNNGREMQFYNPEDGNTTSLWVRPELVHDLDGAVPSIWTGLLP
jgi:hypothetical protein